MTFTHAVSTNNYGPAKFIVDASAANGTHTTIATALTSSSSGDTIFIRPGTYTENITLKAGVNLTAYESDSSLNGTGKVIISGTCTMTTAGSVTISGIQLQTNSANLLAVTGSAASVVNLINCYLNCSNNTGISHTSSDAGSAINLSFCSGNLGTTGIALHVSTSAGAITYRFCTFTNSGASVTASSTSTAQVALINSTFTQVFSTSSTGSLVILWSLLSGTGINTTPVTTAGTVSSSIQHSNIGGGTASAVSIGSGTTVNIRNCILSSSNTNIVTGAGTLQYSGVSFDTSSTTTINTTTQTGGLLVGGKAQAPSAGFIGERANSAVASTGTSLSNGTAANITSISLTAGIWDVYGIGQLQASVAMTQSVLGISTTSATFSGNVGDDEITAIWNAGLLKTLDILTLPSVRLTLTTTTTVYLVAQVNFGSGTANAYGRISATRVG